MKRILFSALCFVANLAFSQIMNIHLNDGQLQQFDVSKIDSITFSSQAGTLKWLGHASVKIKTNEGAVIYIDPYAGDDYAEPADLILVTHGHSDHNQVQLVIQKADCEIYSGSGANVGGTKMAMGDSTDAKGIRIKAVAAYDSHHSIDECVGFVLEFDGIKIYHSGDTGKIPEMDALATLGLDYALLCTDGVFNMSAMEATEVAQTIGVKHAIPIHLTTPGGSEQQKQQTLSQFTPPNKLILKEGDEIYL